MKKIEEKDFHQSQRGYFAGCLYNEMSINPNIFLLTGDLGFGMLDKIRDDFPRRFINCGASEQAMMGLGVGLALEGKIPFIYSITTFLLYRPFETIRTYIDHEIIPVKLVGSGRDKDYSHDSTSHWSEDAKPILDCLPNIVQFWPEEKEEIQKVVKEMIKNKKPSFISLKRQWH